MPKPLLSIHTERRRDPCVVLFTYYIQEYKHTHTHTEREREREKDTKIHRERERQKKPTITTTTIKRNRFTLGKVGLFLSLSFFLSLDRNLVFVYTPREVGFPFKSQGWTVSLKVATKHTTTCMHACIHTHTPTHIAALASTTGEQYQPAIQNRII